MKQTRLGKLAELLCTLGPLGRSPIAPGTLGAVCALPFAWAMRDADWPALLLAAVTVNVLGFAAVARHTRRSSNKDPPEVIIDEFSGCFIATALAPGSLIGQLTAFGLFRALDIIKPWPISVIDRRMKNAWGVMLDDAVAGMVAGGALQAASGLVRFLQNGYSQ